MTFAQAFCQLALFIVGLAIAFFTTLAGSYSEIWDRMRPKDWFFVALGGVLMLPGVLCVFVCAIQGVLSL